MANEFMFELGYPLVTGSKRPALNILISCVDGQAILANVM